MIQAKSLVNMTSGTTGTGALTLDAAVEGYRTFAAAFTAGANCLLAYTIRDRLSSAYERGIGLLSASTTLQRIAVVESSNSDALVSFTGGDLEVQCSEVAAGALLGKNNYTAVVIPTPGDNYADGYGQGSLWFAGIPAGGNHVYLCVDPGSVSVPVANWLKINVGLDMYDVSGTRSPFSVALGGEDDYTASDDVEAVVGTGFGGMAQANGGLVQGHGYAGGNYGSHQRETFGMTKVTTDATPALLVNESYSGSNDRTHYKIPENTTVVFEGWIVANIAGGTSKVWFVEFGVQRVGTGNPALLAAATVTAKFGTTGTAPTIAVNTTDDSIEPTVTGVAATTIEWTGSFVAINAGATP